MTEKNTEINVKIMGQEISIRNMNYKIALILAVAALILCMCVGYSFIKGWSTIHHIVYGKPEPETKILVEPKDELIK
jgi:hydroxylamine reductase (hybrid-cluster protein)